MKEPVAQFVRTTVTLSVLMGCCTIVHAQGVNSSDPQPVIGPDPNAETTQGSVTGAPVDLALPQPVSAEEASPKERDTPGAKSEPANRLIQEVVVTATKRLENVQDVPIAVNAFSGDKLDALDVQSTHDLPKLTPGLTYTASAGYNIVYLRGVGSDAFLPAADQDVPTYLDGVALLQGEGSSDQLGRVSRVEVLKGPQGTLFGRNSTGGAVSIITPDPGPNYSGDVNFEFGNYGTFNPLVFVNLPIVDGLAATISAYDESHNTYQENESGATVATYARGARGKLLWHVTDDLSLNFSALYGETSDNQAMAKQNLRVAPYLSAIVPQAPKLGYDLHENVVGGIVQYNYLFNGGFDWNLHTLEFKFIGSDQKVLATYANYDYDGSPLPLISFEPVGEYGTQQTYELQFLSTPDTPFSKYLTFVGGAYYLEGLGGFPTLRLDVGAPGGLAPGLLSQVPATTGLIAGIDGLLNGLGQPALSALTGPITAVSGGLLSSKSISGYFQGTIHLQDVFDLKDQLNLILGARLDKETRGLQDNRFGALNPLNPTQEIDVVRFSVPNVSAVQVPLRAGLQWYPIDDTQIYGTFSRGFTAPTYNTVNFFSAPDKLQPQRVDSYELGLKSQLFNKTLTFNAAAFEIYEYELLTAFASVTSGGVVRFDNAPSARIRGAEFDTLWQALPEVDPGLALVGSFSYLHGRYTDYPSARGYDAATGLSYGDGAALPARNAKGKDIVRTPPISLNVGLNQSLPVSDSSTLEFGANYNYSAKYYYDPENTPEYATGAYYLLDVRVSYFYEPWGMEVTAFGKNVTGTLYKASVFVLDPGEMVSPNAPRIVGLRFKYSF